MDDRLDAIELLLEKLKKHSELQYVQGREAALRFVRIEAPHDGGFPITLKDELDEWTVYYGYGSAHFHFESAESALNLIALTLSPDCRLIEIWRGDIFQKGSLQTWTGHQWRTAYTSGLLFWPFWRQKRTLVLRNRVLRVEDAPAD